MDWRSFLHNDEAAGVVISDQFGQEMQRMFQRDLVDSVPIDLAKWDARSPIQKIKERAARLWEYWL